METNFLKLYLDQNKKLAKTLVIKSQASIESINILIKLKYGDIGVDKYNPLSWKYYMNISGEYHPLDIPMMVVSLDTLEKIVFSRENLAIHTATLKEYQYDTRYYYSLLKAYPEQEQLILGILYPANKQKAIDAADGAILTYPKDLVEPNEITLISDLEGFIQRQLIRWNVSAFGLSDSLYNTAQHAILYLNILPKLFNLRSARCKTNEAHSFHVREYLASHNGLDRYLPYMTLKQSLYLYRNIRYIERNSGKVEQFRILIDKFLTDRHIPISEFSVRQLSSFDEDYRCDIKVRRKPINAQYNVPEKDYFGLDSLFDKERQLVYGNPLYLENTQLKIAQLFTNSTSSVLQTKDLESSMVDYNDAVPDPLESVLLRQWAHMSTHSLYDAVINFKDPNTAEIRTLHAVDAFIYLYYISLMSIGINVDRIPTYINLKTRSHPKPSLSDLLEVVDNGFTDLPAIAQKLLDDQPTLKRCLSTSSFFDISYKVFEQHQAQWFLVSGTEDLYKRALIANMVYRLYRDEAIIFPVQTYDIADWLTLNNLPPYDFTYDQAQKLIKSIFMAGTGLNVDSSKLLVNIQKAMLAILGQLSSYSVQFIKDINLSKIRPLNWAAIRLGNLKYSGSNLNYIDHGVTIVDQHGTSSKTYPIESNVNKDFNYELQSSSAVYKMSTSLTLTSTPKDERYISAFFDSFRVRITYDAFDPAVSLNAKFIGWEYYIALTDVEKNQIKSIY